MEGFYLILLVILLVFGILQIILFFKVWGMTNDVRRITVHFCGNSDKVTLDDAKDLSEPKFGPGEVVIYVKNGMKLRIVKYRGEGLYDVSDATNSSSIFLVQESDLQK